MVTPFGAIVEEERRFGSFVIPSKVSVGWWSGTPRFEPFFQATVTEAVLDGQDASTCDGVSARSRKREAAGRADGGFGYGMSESV